MSDYLETISSSFKILNKKVKIKNHIINYLNLISNYDIGEARKNSGLIGVSKFLDINID